MFRAFRPVLVVVLLWMSKSRPGPTRGVAPTPSRMFLARALDLLIVKQQAIFRIILKAIWSWNLAESTPLPDTTRPRSPMDLLAQIVSIAPDRVSFSALVAIEFATGVAYRY